MSYRRDKKKSNQRYVVVFIVLLFMMFTPIARVMFDIVEKPFEVAYENIYTITGETKNFLQSWYAKKRLVEERDELKDEIIRLETRLTRFEIMEQEYQDLVNLLSMRQVGESIVGAQILDRFGNESFIINAGEKQGVSLGDRVIMHENVAIGQVSQVYSNTARVDSYTKLNYETASILFPLNQDLLLVGQGGSTMSVAVPREITIEPGMVLYTQHTPGRIIGVVRDVQFDARDPFQQVFVSPPVNMRNAAFVAIVQQQPIQE